MARPLSVDNSLLLLRGLMEILQVNANGDISFPFLETALVDIRRLFGFLDGGTINNSPRSLFKILDAYVNRFPRITSQATFARFDQAINQNPPAVGEGQQPDLDPKLVAIHAVEGKPGEHLDACDSLFRGLLLGAEFMKEKKAKGEEVVDEYRKLKQMADALKDSRLEAGIIDGVTTEDLKGSARDLIHGFKGLKELLGDWGAYEPGQLFANGGEAYATMLGYVRREYDFNALLVGVENGRFLPITQAFLPADVMTAPELIELREVINTEVEAVKKLRDGGDREDHLSQTATLLCGRINKVDEMNHGERLDFIQEIDRLEQACWTEECGGRAGIEVEQLKQLKEGRSKARDLNQEESRTRKLKEKLESELRISKIKELGVVKLIPLTGIRSWLPWLNMYQQMIVDTDVPDIKKLSLIIGSLKDEEDKKSTRDLPLDSVAKYLFEKYHKIHLIISTYQQDLLTMKKANSEQTMEENMRKTLTTFELLQHHDLLEKFDEGFVDALVLLVFTESELNRYLRKRLERQEEPEALSSTQFPEKGTISLLDSSKLELYEQTETAGEKRDYFVSYVRKKLNAIRTIRDQKMLLKQRSSIGGGEKPDKWRGRGDGRGEIKKLEGGGGGNPNHPMTTRKKGQNKTKNPQDRRDGGAVAGGNPPQGASRGCGTQNNPQHSQQGQGGAGPGFKCFLNCQITHVTKKGKLTKSLAYCPKFLQSSPEERDKIAGKIKGLCNTCLNLKSSHRGHTGSCWYTRQCWYCNRPGHSPLLCRNISEDEKEKLRNSSVSSETVKKIVIQDAWSCLADGEQTSSGCQAPPSAEVAGTSPGGTGTTGDLKKTTVPTACGFVKGELDAAAVEYGERIFAAAGGSCQGATGTAYTPQGESIKCQFDIGSTLTIIKNVAAKRLKLPIIRTTKKTINTLTNKATIIQENLYKLKLVDNKGATRTLKALGFASVGGNPMIEGELRRQLAAYFHIPLDQVENPEGELDLLVGLDAGAVMVEIEKHFVSPKNSPNIRVGTSLLVSGYMFLGNLGLDPDLTSEEIKTTSEDLERFIHSESQGSFTVCEDCQTIKCQKCRYESSSLSIIEQAEMESIKENISVIPNPDPDPDTPDQLMFCAQYAFKSDVCADFPRSRNNFNSVLRSTEALRKKLIKMGKLKEYDEQIKKEISKNYMKIVTEEDELTLADFPELYNRLNVSFKKGSTSECRVVNDNSTLHHAGSSCNLAQLKGRTSLNLIHHVLYSFMLHAVPLVLDLASCYRSIRTKLLSNVIRRVIWYEDIDDTSSIVILMMLRMAYGDRCADKIIELICRDWLAAEAEDRANGEIGVRVGRILRHERYLDDCDTSLKSKEEKDACVLLIKKIFSKYSLKAKHFITSSSFASEDEFKQLETTNPDFIETTLGVRWSYRDDTITPATTLNPSKKIRNLYTGPSLAEVWDTMEITKRKFSRILAQLFDACGFMLGIAIIRGKVIYSAICRHGFDWDDTLNGELLTESRQFFKELVDLTENIQPWPRAIIQLNATLIKILGIRDGSATGYGTVIYFVSQTPDGTLFSRSTGAKSRVSNRTMSVNESQSIPLSLNLIANMFSQLETLQTSPNLIVITAGDSESTSFAYDNTKVIKDVLIRNNRNESIRAAKRILSFNQTVNIYFSFVEGKKNSADLISKPHTNLTGKTNSSFYRSGDESYLEADFGIKTQFYHIQPDGTEKFTSLRHAKTENEVKTLIDEEEKEQVRGPAGCTPPRMLDENCDFFYRVLRNSENVDAAINGLAAAWKIVLKKSFKINQEAASQLFSWNDNLIRRTIWKNILRVSQVSFPPTDVKQLLPRYEDGILVTRNRMSREPHIRYFGCAALPIISKQDTELVRVLLHTAHVCKAPAQMGEPQKYCGVIHMSQFLTRSRFKSGRYGCHVPDLRGIVRRHTAACAGCRKEDTKTGSASEGARFLLERWTSEAGVYSIINIDLVGPLFCVPDHELRNSKKTKLFILVIVDLLTGGISFELLANYSTNAFLLGLKTHFARTRTAQVCCCDAGSQLRAAARANDASEEDFLKTAKKGETDLITTAQKLLKRTQFVIAPTETQHVNSAVEVQIKQFKKMLRHFTSRIRHAKLPVFQSIFQLQHLLASIADLLNDRPIFNTDDYIVTANSLLKPYVGVEDRGLDKLEDALHEKYLEFLDIFEDEVRTGTLARAHSTSTQDDKLLPGDFVMLRYPSRAKVTGHFRYGLIEGSVEGSKHRYHLKILERRGRPKRGCKAGPGKPTSVIADISNLTLLNRERPKSEPTEQPSNLTLLDQPSQTVKMNKDIPEDVPVLPKESESEENEKKISYKNRMRARRQARRHERSDPTDQRRAARRAALRGGRKQADTNLSLLSNKFHEVVVTTIDMSTLARDEKLNDAVIDAFAAILQPKYPEVVFISTLIIQKLKHQTTSAVKAITLDVFRYQRMIIPWHFPGKKFNVGGKIKVIMGHWICITVDLARRQIITYDSCYPSEHYNKDLACHKVRELLLQLHIEWRKSALDLTSFKIVHKDSPKQTPGSVDCGVFLCYNMKAAATFSPPTFTASDVDAGRLEIGSIIHRGVV